jgi:hypothetical protein
MEPDKTVLKFGVLNVSVLRFLQFIQMTSLCKCVCVHACMCMHACPYVCPQNFVIDE